jgi:phenylalanyl-tRNA synthetase beta subunit
MAEKDIRPLFVMFKDKEGNIGANIAKEASVYEIKGYLESMLDSLKEQTKIELTEQDDRKENTPAED